MFSGVVYLSLDKERTIIAKSSYPQRAAVIIDGGYWDNILKSIGNPDINLVRLCEDLCNPAYRMRTYYFDGSTEERQPYFDHLQLYDRFDVILGDVATKKFQCSYCSKESVIYGQKRVDMLLAVKLGHLASTKQVDVVILVAGDKDFLPVVKVAKDEGVIIRLAYSRFPKANVAPGLYQNADERIHLTKKFLDKYKKPEKVKEKEEKTKTEEKREKKKKEPIKEFDNKTTQKLVEILAELMKRYRVPVFNTGAFGDHLKQIQFPISFKMREIDELTNGRIKTKYQNNTLHIEICEEDMKKILPNFEPSEDPAVTLLLVSLEELLDEKGKEFVVHYELAERLFVKEPEWKQKYEFKEKHAFSCLLNWASEFIDVKNVAGELFIGLKK